MHIRTITKAHPAPAQDLIIILDVISQIISVVRGIEGLFGFDLGCLLGTEKRPANMPCPE